MRNGNQAYMHKLNLNMVLEEIIETGRISGEDLSKKLPFNRSTIHYLTEELKEQGYIVEAGVESRSVGRSPLMLRFNREAGCIISVDIGPETTAALLTDLLGHPIKFRQIRTPEDPAGLSPQIVELISSLAYMVPPCRFGLAGIAVAVHGVVAGRRIQNTPVYDVAGTDLLYELELNFEAPVHVGSASRLSALGESSFAHHHTNLASVSLHPEVSMGLSVDNQQNTGRSGYVGELGHMTAVCGGRPCYCGRLGCLEQYLSERILLKEFAQSRRLSGASFPMFLAAYQEGDPGADKVAEKFVNYMEAAVNNVLLAYSPDLILLNSSFTDRIPSLLEGIRVRLPARRGLTYRLEASTLGERAPLLGGVSLAVKAFLEIEHFYVRPEASGDV